MNKETDIRPHIHKTNMTMVYVIMSEEETNNSFDRGLGRGEIVAVFTDKERAIRESSRACDSYCVYEMVLDKLYSPDNLNDPDFRLVHPTTCIGSSG